MHQLWSLVVALYHGLSLRGVATGGWLAITFLNWAAARQQELEGHIVWPKIHKKPYYSLFWLAVTGVPLAGSLIWQRDVILDWPNSLEFFLQNNPFVVRVGWWESMVIAFAAVYLGTDGREIIRSIFSRGPR